VTVANTNEQSIAQSSQAQRSLTQISAEKVQGFTPGSGVTVEIIGARTVGQFVILPSRTVDSITIAAALQESINRTATDFASIDTATAIQKPSSIILQSTNLTLSTDKQMEQTFKDSELTNPVRLSTLDTTQSKAWVKVGAKVAGYTPGSIVYLALTSSPIIISEALVDSQGNATVSGMFPAEIAGNGGHSLRVVGTRQFGDVTVNAKGEIQLSDATLAEVVRFDMQTSATVRYSGQNPTGGNSIAIRVVPLRAPLPWWTLWICSWTVFLGLILKLSRKLRGYKELIIGTAVLLISMFPALYYGWREIAYPVMYWGAGIALLGIILLWLVPAIRRRQKPQTPKAESQL
jgi:hypothetical protein